MIQTFKEFLAWELYSRDTIDLKRIYIDIAGDLIAGLLLSQIIYWNLPSKETGKSKLQVKKDGHYWIVKGREDWYNEIRITKRQYDRASKILIEKDLIIPSKTNWKFGGVPKTHLRLNFNKLIHKLNQFITDKQTDIFPINDSIDSIDSIYFTHLIPDNLNTPEFIKVWKEWCNFRKNEKRNRITVTTASKQLKKLAKYDIKISIKAINKSLDSGWTGIFPESIKNITANNDIMREIEGY